MSADVGHPLKTELGLDELRRRTRGLSQRHRTVLLLVNGKRTRREVLTLAGQAGVGAEFFDELVAMGMVDPAPREGAVGAEVKSATVLAERVFAASSEWPLTNPGLDTSMAIEQERAIRDTSTARPAASIEVKPASTPVPRAAEAPGRPVGLPVAERSPLSVADRGVLARQPEPKPASLPPVTPSAAHKSAAVVHAAAASGPPRPKRAAPPVLTLDDAVPLAATRAPPRKAAAPVSAKPIPPMKPPSAKPVAPTTAEPAGARVRFTPTVHKPKAPTRRAPPVELRQEPHLTPVKPPGRPARIKMLAPVGPLDDESEQELLAEVRSLLIGTLLVDGPVTGSLTALRVRKARNRYDLTALVWEIERALVRAKRPREAQSRLTKARDLLGLGNTVVDEETSPGPHTRPQR